MAILETEALKNQPDNNLLFFVSFCTFASGPSTHDEEFSDEFDEEEHLFIQEFFKKIYAKANQQV